MRPRWNPSIDASLRLDRAAVGVLATFLVVVPVDELLVQVPLLRTVLAVLLVGVVPGVLFITLLGIDPTLSARWVVYAVASSLVLFMALGLVMNLALPRIGYAEPLGAGPMTLGLALLVGELVYLVVGRDLVTEEDVRLQVSLDLDRPAVPTAILLPLTAVIAVTVLNVTGNNSLLVVLLGVVAAIPLVSSFRILDGETYAFGLWCLGLALLYHASLWRGFVFGGHGYVVTVWERLRFSPAEIELLPNAVVWPATARLAGIDIMTQLQVVNPLLVALVPVALFVTFRTYTDARRALLGASLFAFSHPFYFLYPPAGRTATPVFFIAVLGAVVSDGSLDALQTRTLSVLAGLGVIVSHYGTSYYVMYAIVVAIALLGALRALDSVVERLAGDTKAEEVDGFVFGNVDTPARLVPRSARVMTLPFAAFYLVGVIGWYMQTGGGKRFEGLVEHVRRTYSSLMTPGTRGSTAARLTTDYGTVSISLSKGIYVIVGILIVVGLASVFYRRVLTTRSTRFDDEYIVFGTAVLVLFSGTFVVSGQWGGGRPMMIVFATTAIFTVIGAESLGGIARRFVDRLDLGGPSRVRVGRSATLRRIRDASPGTSGVGWRFCFSSLLAVMLLLNTGVAAAVVLGGFAPSNVPLQEDLASSPSPNHQSKLYVDNDVRTHAWLADHRDPSLAVYGDRLARAQTTDRYSSEIAHRSDRSPYRFKKRNHIDNAYPRFEAGYIVLLGHNVEHGTLAVNYIEWQLLEEYDLATNRTATVYVNDHGRIHYRETNSLADED